MKTIASVGLALVATMQSAFAAEPRTLPLWPGTPPGEVTELPPEADQGPDKGSDGLIAGRPIIRLGNVSTPTITIYSPPAEKNTGAAVVVCPGGGYYILAMDLEGTEVCQWLNTIGVTGVLLKYRVPAQDEARRPAPLQDVQRALGMVRAQATELGIDPARIGVLGFSAGGHLSALVSANHATRSYPAIDAADAVSCRPDFTVLVYPGGLADREHGEAVPANVAPSAATPPVFLVMAQDDPVRVENVLSYYAALQRVKVPAELHVYPHGGHGYGLRRTELPVTTWPDRLADWLKAGGWLKPRQATTAAAAN